MDAWRKESTMYQNEVNPGYHIEGSVVTGIPPVTRTWMDREDMQDLATSVNQVCHSLES